MTKQNFDKAYEEVKKLVAKFKQGEKHYLSQSYQEAEVRQDFLDDFFIALGWDVGHKTQHDPYEQEVKVEKGVRVSGAQKRADYSFTIAPNFRDTKFFAEAKKPSKTLKNAQDYFQSIRYGWHKGHPLSILTDFEEFHILDCRYTPDINNSLDKCFKRFHYTDYLNKEKFAEIYFLFSRESVASNSIEKVAQSLPKRKGKATTKTLFPLEQHQTIDEAFLEVIDSIREKLAKAFKKQDENLTSEELTEATQRTVDRLVFIRFLEDKLIEQEHYVSEFGEKGSAWSDFISTCRKLDIKYNGIVFKKHFIDAQLFGGPEANEFYAICQDICHLNSRFLYNEIPIHILGSIYERFLGKVVHATAKRVTVEEKPEVQKAGGVYYTPKYIVDYIVKNTIGKLIEGNSPEQIAKLRFADIACGSGSFLIGVFDCILDYHNKYYQKHPDKAKKDKCIEKDGLWVLSILQKQKILRNNIYGVDIDQQATEVTQLSLALKMLEDETTATANDMQVLFHEKILPDMSKNIICGNAIIGTDILSFNGFFSGEEERILNPMDFHDVFKDIMREGGFDAIVGNPPYFRIDEDKLESNYVRQKFATTEFKVDIYSLFIEKIISQIGFKRFGYIIPNTLMTNLTDRKLRKLILEKTHIDEIVNYRIRVFDQAVVHTMILILDKDLNNKNINIKEVSSDKTDSFKIKQSDLLKNENYSFDIRMFGKDSVFLKKIKLKGVQFNTLCDLRQAIKTGDDKKYIFNKKLKKNYKEVIGGSEMNRYTLNWEGRYVDYGDYLACPRDPHIFEVAEKIIIRETGKRITATYDDKKYYLMSSVYSAFLLDTVKDYNLKYILGALNSNVSQYYMQKLCFDNSSGAFIKARIFHYNQLPIPRINFKNKTEKAAHDRIVTLVEQILNAKKEVETAKTEKDKAYIARKISSYDTAIDELIYKLYDLSKDEIKIVEEK